MVHKDSCSFFVANSGYICLVGAALPKYLLAGRSDGVEMHPGGGGLAVEYPFWLCSKRAAEWLTIPNAEFNLDINRFLVNQLGFIPARQIITDHTPKKYQEAIREQNRQLAEEVSAEMEFVEGGYIAGELLNFFLLRM